MVQTLAVYVLVAAATGYVIWRLFLRGYLKRQAAARAAKAGGEDCACGDS